MDILGKSLKEYHFDEPVQDPASPHQFKVVAHFAGQPVGQLTFNAQAHTDPEHPHHGYHTVSGANVSALHRAQGVYGRLLHLGAEHVKKQLGGKGLVAPGAHLLVQKSEKDQETSPDNLRHEFDVEFKRWFQARTEGKAFTPHAAYDMDKAEADLSNLLGTHSNLNNEVAEGHHEVARQMVGYDPQHSPEFMAARFIAGGSFAPEDSVRVAMVLYDTDFELAALRAYGLPRNDYYRELLRATMALRSYLPELNKSDIDTAVIPRDIKAASPDAEEMAEAVRRAQATGNLISVQLDPSAKHSKGTAIATDRDSAKKYLLKPGSGKASPSAGAREDPSDQSQREVAFAKIVEAIGIGEFYPKAELLTIDGQRVAAMDLLAMDYKGLEKIRQNDDSFDPTKLFQPYMNNGALYKWALADWVFGNPDCHANNIMVNEDRTDLKLIDHGSAFAGHAFDPAHDPKSFVPFYLRAWAQDKVWSQLNAQEREDEIPVMSADDSLKFGKWIDSINEAEIVQIMSQYGINPEPSMTRLNQIKAVPPEKRADLLIGLWTGAST